MAMTQLGGAMPAVTQKQTPMQDHAERLHILAGDFSGQNTRLSDLLGRLRGANPPQETSAATPVSQPGVLYAAQFGAQRLGNELDQLTNLVTELEQLV